MDRKVVIIPTYNEKENIEKIIRAVMDLEGEEKELTLDQLLKLHSLKTGALITASCVLGALAAGVSFADERMRDVITYSENIGLAFQIVDDILSYRQVTKLKSTYTDGLLKVADEAGKVHTNFKQTGTATGRLSSPAGYHQG